MRADLHIHTAYSRDCSMPPEKIVSRCLERKINCIAITDHNTITGALKMREVAPFTVIMGEEILTSHGEIIGFFLKEEVPKGLSPQETVDEIKSQGGLVCIPHPFDRFRLSALKNQKIKILIPQIDIVETFNSRTILAADSEKARLFAQTHGFPASAGSDAHTPGEIGNAYVEMPEFNGPDEFLQVLRQGKVVGHRSSPLIHINSTWNKLSNKLSKR